MAFLQAIGFGNKDKKGNKEVKQCATDDQLREFRRLKFIRDAWDNDVLMIRSIIEQLAEDFDYIYWCGCAICRYGPLKDMISNALENHQEATKIHRSNLRKMEKRTGNEGALSRLNQDLATLTGDQKRGKQEWEYTRDQIETEIRVFQDRITYFRSTYETIDQKLQTLSERFSLSKNYSFLRRYPMLKRMVRETVRDFV